MRLSFVPVSNTMSFQARHNGQNYVFALLTGYCDPPAGVTVFSASQLANNLSTNRNYNILS